MSSSDSQEAYSLFTAYVIQRTKKLEHLFEQNHGAVGRGLGEKVSNIEHKLDSGMVRQLRFIITIRNKMTHEVNYIYDGNPDVFLRKCDEMIRRFSQPSAPRQTHQGYQHTDTPPRPKVGPTHGYSKTTSSTRSYSRPSSSNYASTSSSNSAPTSSHRKVREGGKPLLPPSRKRKIYRVAFIVIVLVVAAYFKDQILPAITYQPDHLSSSTEPASSRPDPQITVQAEKTSRGRTPNEKMYQFTVPAKTWVETSIKIKPNQEVNIHHFSSDERITVNFGNFTDDTVIPLYTSKDCSKDRGIQANVQYNCVQLSQPETVKLYAENSVTVGIYIRNR